MKDQTIPVIAPGEATRFTEQVAALAYALWEARGAPEGTPEKDWYQAEHVLVPKNTGIL